MKDGLSKAFREELTRAATDLVNRLATIVRNAEVYDPNNAFWKPQIAGLTTALAPLLRAEKLALIEMSDGQFSINKGLLRAGFSEFETFRYLAEAMARTGVGAIELRGIPDEVEIKKFAFAWSKQITADVQPKFEEVQRAVSAVSRRIILTAAKVSAAPVVSHRDAAAHAVYTFLKGVSAVHEVMEGLRKNQSVGFKRAKRFVQNAVDLLGVDRGLLLSLTTIKNYDDYLYNHSVNVCLLSLVVGAKLGFDKVRLGELGLAALLRDVGKAQIPKELLEKRGKLTAEEWSKMRAFPHAAVTGLLRFRGFNEGALRQVIVAFEHKFKAPGSDAPQKDRNLFSKIAHLADAYDAMTTPRPYRPEPLPPDEALRNLIIDRHVTASDPALIKAFIHAIGLYPVGSVVLLDTNEIAVVAAPPFDMSSIVRPRVRLVSDSRGDALPNAPLVDLMQFDETRRVYQRSIAKTLRSGTYGINVAKHLLTDAGIQ